MLNADTIQAFLVAFISAYAFSLTTDLGRTFLEVFFNAIRKRDSRELQKFSAEELAIVIPCHNSEHEIGPTLKTLPTQYKVYCVLNACTDGTRAAIEALQLPHVEIIETTEPGKIRAVLLGAMRARQKQHSHFLLLDDDIEWSSLFPDVATYDKTKPVTALPVIPTKDPANWLRASQTLEYQIMCASKRAQATLNNVIMASGAAGIYRMDTFFDAMKDHDGEHIGDDLQCSYIHHHKGYKIDFITEEVVRTKPPYSFKQWWKQRAKRWEVSPVFNLYWALRIIFRRPGRGPGWHIRGVTLYRTLVVFNDILRLVSFPVVLVTAPQVLLGVWGITYVSVMLKLLVFRFFFRKESYVLWDKIMLSSILTYPLYGTLMWISRVRAIPKGVALNWRYYIKSKRSLNTLGSKFETLERELL